MSPLIISETPACCAPWRKAEVKICHLTSSQMKKLPKYEILSVFYGLWFAIAQVCLFIFKVTWPLGDFSACGACWADLHSGKSQIMICNLSYQACDRPFSLVSNKHSLMFKMGQFRSVDQPRWYTGPLGLLFSGSLDPLWVDKGSTVTVGREELVWFVGSQYSPRFSFSPGDMALKCQPQHQEQI